jgi:quinol monooxygenase YgiN
MIIVRITMNVLPEKYLEFTQTLLSLIEPSGKEAGCLNYAVFCDIEDKNRFNLLEEWKTREALDHHIMSHRFGVLLGTKALLCEPLQMPRAFTEKLTIGIRNSMLSCVPLKATKRKRIRIPC